MVKRVLQCMSVELSSVSGRSGFGLHRDHRAGPKAVRPVPFASASLRAPEGFCDRSLFEGLASGFGPYWDHPAGPQRSQTRSGPHRDRPAGPGLSWPFSTRL